MKQERIVVIDDNANDALLVRRFLEREGYLVSVATSGEEGLRLVAETYPDCIVVDYRMPGMDGYEVSGRIKNDPAIRNIPVLMLTGADSSRNVIEGLESGADDFVTKGSDVEVLLARLRALLRVKAYQDTIVEQSEQLRRLYEEIKTKSERIMALNQRLNSDLEIARKVQETLLPAPSLKTPRAEIRARYIPTEALSGDFYDYFLVRDSLYLFIADVSGHGLGAAILVSLLKSYIRSEATEQEPLARLMAQLNDFLVTASLPAQFATAQLFRLDRKGRLSYSTAAHPAFLLYRGETGRTEEHEQPGHLLGALPSMEFDEHIVEVSQGDVLFVYTDGLTDRKNDRGDFFSLEEISRILESRAGEPLSAIDEALNGAMTGFAATEELKDDIAWVVVRFE
jgi:phosphoserine phosphatase RsbU/P